MKRHILFLLFALLANCKSNGLTGESMRKQLREEARAALKRECGTCHIPELSTAMPAALAVYNLSADDWAASMNDKQLDKLSTRFPGGALEMWDPYDTRNAGKQPPLPPSPEDISAVANFVQVEKRARQSFAH